LSYGQLALLFVAYVVYLRSHRLCEMEEWVGQHQIVLQQTTHWPIRVEDATDDRLGDLLSVLGEDEERSARLQRELGQHLIQAYSLPTDIARYDTTTFSVHHAPDAHGQAGGGLLTFGHSKDHRPDLVQFKQGLGTLDPAGVPLFTHTLAGNGADDPLYVPAWREMATTMGHTHFLLTADCKAAALGTRAQIDHEQGFYLFPLPMTGRTPALLCDWVLDPPTLSVPIALEDVIGVDGLPKVVGSGFVVELGIYATWEDGQTRHRWMERWLVTRSDSLAQRQQAALERRLVKVEAELPRLNRQGFTTAGELEQAAQQVLKRRSVSGFLDVAVHETVTEQTRYLGPGRPGPNRPKQVIVVRQAHLTVSRNEAAITEAQQLAGWRIHVTNVPAAQMSLPQAIGYYRDEFLVEQGMHRFKRGSLPVLPLFLRLPERIRGLLLLLLIALQLLTLLEFVAQRELARRQETLSGLVPGNPKMKTSHPRAERMLARFTGLHWLGEQTESGVTGRVVETLTPIQRRILDLLGVPGSIYTYTLNVITSVHNYYNST
jgi:transposase